MTTIEINNRTYNIATEWNELNADQLLQVMDVFESKTYTAEQMIMKLFKILLGMSWYRWFRMRVEDFDDLLYLTGFLLSGEIRLTRQLIPKYDKLYGPSDNLGNLVMGEFVFTEHYFMNWQEKRDDINLLNNLVAVLYRPAKKNYDFIRNPDGDCRQPFNENVCAWYSDMFISTWPMNVKLAIAAYYAGCRQQIVDENPDVFGGSGEPAKYGLISIIRSIAKDGTHGDFESVEKKAISLIMIELNEVVEEGRRLEQQAKSAK